MREAKVEIQSYRTDIAKERINEAYERLHSWANESKDEKKLADALAKLLEARRQIEKLTSQVEYFYDGEGSQEE
jgi:hypothetical protein